MSEDDAWRLAQLAIDRFGTDAEAEIQRLGHAMMAAGNLDLVEHLFAAFTVLRSGMDGKPPAQ